MGDTENSLVIAEGERGRKACDYKDYCDKGLMMKSFSVGFLTVCFLALCFVCLFLKQNLTTM